LPDYSTSQIAISLSHFYAYSQISEKYQYGLILEDDVILSDKFTTQFAKYMSQLPPDFDMLFIGDGCNLHIERDKIISGKHIYAKGLYPTRWGGYGISRCADSYVVSKRCATKLVDYLSRLSYPIQWPVDFWLNIAGVHNQLAVYWAEPTIATQGTDTGLFATSHPDDYANQPRTKRFGLHFATPIPRGRNSRYTRPALADQNIIEQNGIN
jgi:GR25 family glycosyltransferase involved in LPS biosynthesis